MIEKIIYDYLSDTTTGLDCNVYMEKPITQSEKYVLIEKAGGGITNHVWEAMITIQSYAGSMYEAAALNNAVVKAMLGITSLNAISKCDINSDYNFTDTTKKGYRYQAVFDLVYFDE